MKSRSIGGVAAAAAAAAAAEPEVGALEGNEPTATEGTALGGAYALGAEAVVDAEFGDGGSSEAADGMGEAADETGAPEEESPAAGNAIGADMEAAGDPTDTPGGGAATASGSSMSSSGRSGSCSSKGDTGTLANSLGAVGLVVVAEASAPDGAGGGCEAEGSSTNGSSGASGSCNSKGSCSRGSCNAVRVPLAEVPPAGIGTADVFDGPSAAGEAWDAPATDVADGGVPA